MAKDFCHLHLHTAYSFLDGAIRIADLFPKLEQLGMKSVAITDHGNMFGTVDFYTQAKAAGVKPILGMEAYVAGERGCRDRSVRESYHMVLLAENDVGYKNLVKLASAAYLEGFYYVPRVDKPLLEKHSEGIIALSACMSGEVARRFLNGEHDQAVQAARDYKAIFGKDNFFLEVQPNGMERQNQVNAFLGELASDLDLPLIATNDCHYLEREHHEAQDILMCIRQQKMVDDPRRHKHEVDAFYVRSGDEMWDLLKTDFPEAHANTMRIAERCDVTIDLGNIYLPAFPVPEGYQNTDDYLCDLARRGLEARYEEMDGEIDREAYSARLERELGVIVDMEFPGYFLIVQDFINEAKRRDIRVGPGRGSGAGSLVAFALRITDIDPLPYDLLFERFLNPERKSMPDFDVDFMQERRGEVIDYVAEKYGREHVAQIATYAALNAKSAIKDVARVLGVPFNEVNQLTKLIPSLLDGKKVGLQQALKLEPKLTEIQKANPVFEKIISNALVLEGLFRQAGMHAAGVVIGDQELTHYTPLFLGANKELVSQFDMKRVEKVGLVKFDFLGLKTLDVIAAAERHVNERIEHENGLSGEALEVAAARHPHAKKRAPGEPIPKLDCALLDLKAPEVYDLITHGETLGVFQLESSGFQELMKRIKPDGFEDVVAAVALYRPGPIQAGMVDDYVDRKHGRMKVSYPHPCLEQVLKPTYGTILYQEQVMQIAQVMAGFTLGGADILRRAMGKKQFDVMAEQRKVFVQGAEERDIDPEVSNGIFDLVDKFAGYGFNKSHSAAYAAITYQTAYLKAFYPVEFMAALLTTESGSTDDIVKYVAETRRMNIEVLPPDVNTSRRSFRVERPDGFEGKARVRFGLSAVKGLGDAALDAIIEERDANGPFEGLFQLCERVSLSKINRKVLEALVHSGALDFMGRPRAQLFSAVERAIEAAQPLQRASAIGQETLFSMFASAPPAKGGNGDAAGQAPSAVSAERYDDIEEWQEKERLTRERVALGFYLTGHPLDDFKDDLHRLAPTDARSLLKAGSSAEVSVAGVVASLSEKTMRDGSGRWAIVNLEGRKGNIEVRVFSKVYVQTEELLKSNDPLWIKGKTPYEYDGGEAKITAEEILPLAQVRAERTRAVVVRLSEGLGDVQETLLRLREIFMRHHGKTPVRMVVLREGHSKTLIEAGTAVRVTPNEHLQSEVDRLLGKGSTSFM